jgi:hypothetical protein
MRLCLVISELWPTFLLLFIEITALIAKEFQSESKSGWKLEAN